MGFVWKKEIRGILSILIMGCIIMSFVDAYWHPGYAVKSGIKIVVFFVVPFGYSLVNKNIQLRSLFVIKKAGMIRAVWFGIGVYLFILVSYFTIGTFFDFSEVTGALTKNVGVNKENFAAVALYISFINSLLEEFFFRGFAFMNLRNVVGRRWAYFVSAIVFALYHVAMMIGWFSIPLFLLLLASLIGAGLLFDWLNEKQGNIYTSWFVHMFANFSINTVGFILFGII